MTVGENRQTRWWVEDGVGYVVLDNPPMNLLTETMCEGVAGALEEFRRARARAVVLTGAGERAFCGGADLREEAELTTETTEAFHRRHEAVTVGLRRYERPVIAALNGWTMGGGLVLALWCDVRIGSTAARLGAVGVKVGLVASAVQLARLLPEGRARDALLTGRTLEAAEAYRMGLLSAVVPPGRLMAEAAAWAARMAARDPERVARVKQAMNGALELPLEAAEARERALWEAT